MRRPLRPLVVLALAVLAPAACTPSEPTSSTGAAPSPPAAASPASDGCPASYDAAAAQPWVPAPPTTETPGGLVPDADPVEALVCRYGEPAGAAAPLVGSRALTAGLERIRTELRLPGRSAGPTSCASAGPARAPHLVRLRYADGELWLSAAVQEPGSCTATSNGAFVTAASLGDRFAQAYDTGTWPAGGAAPASG